MRLRLGIAAGKKRGARMGRRPVLSKSRLQLAHQLVADGERPTEVARFWRVGRATVYRALKQSARLRFWSGAHFGRTRSIA